MMQSLPLCGLNVGCPCRRHGDAHCPHSKKSTRSLRQAWQVFTVLWLCMWVQGMVAGGVALPSGNNQGGGRMDGFAASFAAGVGRRRGDQDTIWPVEDTKLRRLRLRSIREYHHRSQRQGHAMDCANTPAVPWQLNNASLCEEYHVNGNFTGQAKAEVEIKVFQYSMYNQAASGHVVIVKNPLQHFTVVPPPHGCGNGVGATVAQTSASFNVSKSYTVPAQPPWRGTIRDEQGNLTHFTTTTVSQPGCIVATNAGFFNTSTFGCYGNLVSNGEILATSDRLNAHFGIRDGKFVVGYLTPGEAVNAERPFDQLVGGVGWLVRGGKPYVYDSFTYLEDMSAQETGPSFATIASGRTAIGHDAEGNLVIAQLDGQSWVSGINLYTFGTILVELGVVNAINLDGGGSTTMVLNTTLINSPTYQECPGEPPLVEGHDAKFRCERNVTSIVCIHNQPEAPPLPPMPTCPALPSKSRFPCGTCLLLFAACKDSRTEFGVSGSSNVTAARQLPIPGWPDERNGATVAHPMYLELCQECCGCYEWFGSGQVVFPPVPGEGPPPLEISTITLATVLVCSVLCNVAALYVWHRNRQEALLLRQNGFKPAGTQSPGLEYADQAAPHLHPSPVQRVSEPRRNSRRLSRRDRGGNDTSTAGGMGIELELASLPNGSASGDEQLPTTLVAHGEDSPPSVSPPPPGPTPRHRPPAPPSRPPTVGRQHRHRTFSHDGHDNGGVSNSQVAVVGVAGGTRVEEAQQPPFVHGTPVVGSGSHQPPPKVHGRRRVRRGGNGAAVVASPVADVILQQQSVGIVNASRDSEDEYHGYDRDVDESRGLLGSK